MIFKYLIIACISLFLDGRVYAGESTPTIAFAKEDTMLRQFPDYTADEILKIRLGSRIEVLKEAGAWCRVSLESAGGVKRGWVKRASLKFLE